VRNLVGTGGDMSPTGTVIYASTSAGAGVGTAAYVTNSGWTGNAPVNMQPSTGASCFFYGVWNGVTTAYTPPLFGVSMNNTFAYPSFAYNLFIDGSNFLDCGTNSGGAQQTVTGTIAVVANVPFCGIATFSSTGNNVVYFNGVQSASSSSGGAILYGTLPQVSSGFALGGNAAQQSNTILLLGATWNRALSPTEVQILSRQPFALLRPMRKTVTAMQFPTLQQIVLTSGSTWTVPTAISSGATLQVESWGAGSGGSGRVGSNYGAGGGAGAYVKSSYIITPNDIANGISYVIGTGSAGSSGANPSTGGNTSWSTNNLNLIRNTTNVGAITGSPGTIPTNWLANNGTAGLTQTVVGFGTDPGTGLPYIDVNWTGTTTSTYTGLFFDTAAVGIAADQYLISCYVGVVGGSLTNLSNAGFNLECNAYNGGTYISTSTTYFSSIVNTLTRYVSTNFTAPASTTILQPFFQFGFNSTGLAVNVTFRLAGMQFEQTSSSTPTYFKTTPGYSLAAGGNPPSGTTGGTGGTTAASIGTLAYAGGAGAAYSASGSGGGGAAGNAGAGGNATANGGNGIGGAGAAVSAITPGNAGTANVEGGGGGGGLTVAGTAGAGAIPAGGGGGAAVATGTGGAGANGQIRLTYQQIFPYVSRVNRKFLLRR
jgi:hypothetical protein